MRFGLLLLLLAPIVATAGTITGNVSHRERLALPEDATVVVRLEGAARFNRPARVISEVRFIAGGAQSPFAYSLPYSDAAVRTGNFAVEAEIWVGGKLRFASSDAYPVIRNGKTRVDILVRSAPGSTSLQGTKWMLVELNGRSSLGDTAFIRFDGRMRSAGGNTGVNVFGGDYTLNGTDLIITPGPQTMMAGSPEMMEQERAFLSALRRVATFRIRGSMLELIADGIVLARFRAVSDG